MVLRRKIGLAIAIIGILCAPSGASATDTAVADCNAIHRRPCVSIAGERKVTLDITPKPVRHMSPLRFSVTIEPATGLPDVFLLDLSMPGMAMGRNQVRMTRTGTDTWQGEGVIVRCMSGRTLWRATILLPGTGNPSFTFNVRD